jgi:rubrerythrin
MHILHEATFGGRSVLVSPIAAENRVTVNNLQIAFQSRANAQAKYLAFAAKADSDGMHEAASLFRAIAHSAQIHAHNHARVIRRLGGDPVAPVQAAEVKTTKENLSAAFDDESRQVDSMYPHFLSETYATNNSAARTLKWALEAEKTYTSMLAEEINRVEAEDSRASAGTEFGFYVRPVCGMVSETPEPQRCWACDNFCGTFEVVR